MEKEILHQIILGNFFLFSLYFSSLFSHLLSLLLLYIFDRVDIPWVFWLEWLITTPMLAYIVFLAQNKSTYSSSEYIIIIAQILQIVFAYCIHYDDNYSQMLPKGLLPKIFLFLSLCCLCIASVMVVHSYRQLYMSLNISKTIPPSSLTSSPSTTSISTSTSSSLTSSTSSTQPNIASTMTDSSVINYIKAKQIHSLACIYFVILCSYFSIYFLRAFLIFDDDLMAISILVINFLSRIIFNEYASNSYIEYFHGSNAKLLAAKKADEERIAYLKYVFHEARVPLQSFTLGLQLFCDPKTSFNEKKEMLQVMKEATEFISNTFDDVLSIQRIESGALLLKIESFNFKKSLKSLTTSLINPIHSKQLDFIIDISPQLPSLLLGDGFRLTHVVANFLSNSIKFSPPNSKLILRVTCHVYNVPSRSNTLPSLTSTSTSPSSIALLSPESSPPPPSPLPLSSSSLTESSSLSSQSSISSHTLHLFQNSYQDCELTVEVIDQGIGISEFDQLNLFQPYMQVNPEKIQGGRGTGIGLTLCKQIITMHGGKLICRSKPGEGSTFGFVLTLPVIDSNPWSPKEENNLQNNIYEQNSTNNNNNNNNTNFTSNNHNNQIRNRKNNNSRVVRFGLNPLLYSTTSGSQQKISNQPSSNHILVVDGKLYFILIY